MNAQSQVVLKYPFVFLVAFLVTYVLTPAVRALSRRIGLVDLPGGRKTHAGPTPLGGGIALAAGFHAAAAAVFLFPWLPFGGSSSLAWWRPFVGISLCLLALGLLDDRVRLPALVKLLGQTAIAAWSYAAGMRVGNVLGFALAPELNFILTVLWFLTFINAFNLIDGADGLATGLGLIAALGMAGSFLIRRMPSDALLLLALAGACLAFLRYNFHPASIFLGDAGSMFIGFTIAAVAIGAGARGTAIATIGVPLLAAGVPVLDTTLAVWRRLARGLVPGKRGAGVFSPDAEHLHHRMLRDGYSPRHAVGLLYAVGVVAVGVGLSTQVFRSQAVGIYIVAFVTAAWMIVRHLAHVEMWDSGAAILHGLRRPPSRALCVILYPPLDVAALALCLWIALWLSCPAGTDGGRHLWIELLPSWTGIPFLFLCVSLTYRRVWSRARISEYAYLCTALAAGIVIAGAIELALPNGLGGRVRLLTPLYAGMAVPLLAAGRAFPRIVHDALLWFQRRGGRPQGAVSHVIVVGADPAATLFLRAHALDPLSPENRRIVIGLLDEDANLHGRIVHGYRVLGAARDLPRLASRLRIDEAIIASPASTSTRQALLAAARAARIPVFEWEARLRPVAGGCNTAPGAAPPHETLTPASSEPDRPDPRLGP